MEENDFGSRTPSDRIQISCASDVFLSFESTVRAERKAEVFSQRNTAHGSINNDGIEHKATSTLRIKDSGKTLSSIGSN